MPQCVELRRAFNTTTGASRGRAVRVAILAVAFTFSVPRLTRFGLAASASLNEMPCLSIAATSSFAPDPHRETTWSAWVKGTSSGCTRFRSRI